MADSWRPRHWLTVGALVLAGCGEPEPRIDPSLFPFTLDLAPRLANAESSFETRLIDLGTPSGHASQVADWGDDGVFEGDGSTFAWSLGTGSSLQLTVLEPRRLRVTARLRPYRIDGPAQKVAIEANGNAVTVLSLKGGMRTYRFELPAEALVRGGNLLELRNIYPEDIGPGPPDLGPPGTAWDYLAIDDGRAVARPSTSGGTLFLPFGSAVSFYVEIDGATLSPRGDQGGETLLTLERLESTGRYGRLHVRRRGDGDPEDAFAGELRAVSGPLTLDLETDRPSVIELTLVSVGEGGSGGAGGLRLRRPKLRSAAAVHTAPLDASAAGPAESSPDPTPPPPRRPNVLVYLVDTLRADHLGCYGYSGSTSPAIDAFAAASVVFENAYAQSSWTRSSVASLFTGLLPTTHAVLSRNDALSEEATTLAEIMRRQGYASAAFVTNRSAGESFGFAQGFETFEYLGKGTRRRGHHTRSDAVHRAAVAWLDKPRRRPFFLYLHTLDPHAPYWPPEEERRAFAPGVRRPDVGPAVRTAMEKFQKRVEGSASAPVEAGSLTWLHALQRELVPVQPAIIEDLVSLYDAEVFSNDRSFGELLEHLKGLGIYDETIIVFVSDHGEEFYDHGGWQHGRTLYQEQLRIPLIVRLPGGPEGVRFEHPAQHIDLLPTLADILGLPLPTGVQGESLWPHLQHPETVEPRPRSVYSHLELDERFAESLVRGRFKLVCTTSSAADCQLFDLLEDPGERQDLAPRRPVLLGYLRQWLRTFRRADGGLEVTAADIDAEVRQQLEALGYL